MNNDYKDVSLETIGGGVAVESFNESLEEALENILDCNTHPTEAREVHLVVKMKPGVDDRGTIEYNVQSWAKLSKRNPFGSKMFAGRRRGQLIAMEQNLEQEKLPFDHNGYDEKPSMEVVR